MSLEVYEVKPVTHITTNAIGEPGKRVFYLQAKSEDQLLTFLIEKQQVQSLAVGVEQFLSDLHRRFPDLHEASPSYVEEDMALHKPIDPLFRIGQIGLGYDEEEDLLVLVAHELSAEIDEADEEGASVARIWCSRDQLRAMCHWGLELANRGRPICGHCGQPIDVGGHFCPKRNGHKH